MSDQDRQKNANVLMGRIGAAHGIRGEVRIQSFCADPLDIKAYGPLTTDKDEPAIEILSARVSKNMVIARLKGVDDRNAAEKLNGRKLFVARDKLPAEDDEDDFYHADLIGLEVRNGEGRVMGKIVSIPDFGAGDLIEFRDLDGEATLVPFTRTNVPEVNVTEGYVVVLPMEEIDGEVHE